MIKVDDKDQGVTYQVYKSEIQTSNFTLNNSMLWSHFSKKKKKKINGQIKIFYRKDTK